MIKAIIIEDEQQLLETNKMLLLDNFPNIKIVGEAGHVDEAVRLIQAEKPQLVLMDIELADGNCFQVLQRCKPYTFRPIFITAYNQYAIKAIKFSASNYILKPVNEFEFCDAVEQAISQIEKADETELQTDQFIDNYNSTTQPKKLVLRTSEALYIVNVQDIQYCKSDNSYTSFFMKEQKEIVVSKSIKEFAELLADYNFLRPHQSYLVNINAIAKIDKSDGSYIILLNGTEIPISARRKQHVLDQLEQL